MNPDSSKTIRQRIFGFDLLKAFALYFVIMIHFVPLFYGGSGNVLPLITVLASGATTIFFMINGFLLFSKPLNARKHYQKTIQTLLSLLIWRVITYFAFCAVYGREVSGFSGTRILSYILGTDFDGVVMGYSWFMYSLIGMWFIFPVLKLCYDQPDGKIYIGILILILFLILCVSGSGDLVNNLIQRRSGHTNELSFEGLYRLNVFGDQGRWIISFMIGGLLRDIAAFIERKLKKAGFLGFVLAGWLITWFSLYCVLRIQGKASGQIGFSLNDDVRLNTSLLLHSFLSCLLFSKINIHHKIIRRPAEEIGKNTLGIYYIHFIPVVWIQIHLRDVLLPHPLLGGVTVPMIILFICLVLVMVLKKIPFIRKIL